jgi:CheY-like chemotaxis protein
MPLTTIRVLLVEDEAIIRMMLADMIERLGHAVTAEAGNIGRATELAQSGLFDLAILDVNLNGKLSFPAAEILLERRIPLIFASGYAADSFPAEFRSTPQLRKPFQIETLAKAITVAREGASH